MAEGKFSGFFDYALGLPQSGILRAALRMTTGRGSPMTGHEGKSKHVNYLGNEKGGGDGLG